MPQNRMFQQASFVCYACRTRMTGYPHKRDPQGRTLCRRCYDKTPSRIRYFRRYRENNPDRRREYEISRVLKNNPPQDIDKK